MGERFGWYPAEVLNEIEGSRPIWIHAASVGEVTAAAELIYELKAHLPSRKIIVSTFTQTGRETARRLTKANAVLFLPVDQLWIVRRALKRLDPSLLIILETEIWPNLLREAYRKGVPALLLSGRLSVGSLERYSFFRGFFSQVIECFAVMGMQSEEDARRIRNLGADDRRVAVVGNLKYAVSSRRNVNRANTEQDKNVPVKGKNPLLVVGSSHEGEEQVLIAIYRSLKKKLPTLQMVLAPRHPQRFIDVERLLQAEGVNYDKKSSINGRLNLDRDVLLLDTMGDLQDFYAIADVAFVGGSLVEAGGHNLLEPARFHKPVVFGPHMENFASLASEMKRVGAGVEVTGSEELTAALEDLLGNPEKCRTFGEKAYSIATDDRAVMQKTLALVEPYLPSERIQ